MGESMSSYENYDEVSRVYDRMRRPVGVQQTLDWLSRSAPATTLDVLDAGCGTGQFSEALLPHVGSLQCVELNPGMLGVARSKLAHAGSRVTLQQGDLLSLPLADNSVDGVCVNQVLHHLPDDDGWSLHRRAFAEFRRVLRPGGSFVLNTTTAEQILKGYWYFRLLPQRAARDIGDRYAPLEVVDDLLRAAGFEELKRNIPAQPIFGENYLRSDGPLDADWRRADSTWTLATPEELQAILERVRGMQALGTLDAWMHQADAQRADIGQVTLVAAR
jgi:ubiquinone/menaquinone biosynthesis C-methylase UbiE